jgi:hypothetical protein
MFARGDCGTALALTPPEEVSVTVRTIRRWGFSVVSIVAAVCGTVVYLEARALAGPAPSQSAASIDEVGESFTADLTIRRQMVTSDGERVASDVPRKRFRIARVRTSAGWQVRMTLDAVDRYIVETRDGRRALDNPFLITRWDFDERTRTTRIYNVKGEEVRVPSGSNRRLLGLPPAPHDAKWDLAPVRVADASMPIAANGLVLTEQDHAIRRGRIERQFGRPVGRVRGLDRYLSAGRDITYEMLVVPESALPAEMNVALGGRLVSHTTFVHENHSSGVLIRRRLTSEHLLPHPASGDRSVLEVDLANVRLGSSEGVQ